MNSSDFRAEARKNLEGKWKKAVFLVLGYLVVSFLINLVFGFFPKKWQDFLSIVETVIEIPLSFGFITSLFKLFNDEQVGAFEFISSGFNNFGKAWGITWNIFLKMLFPVILMIISYMLIAFGIASSFTSAILSSSHSSGFGALSVIGFILLIVSGIWSMTKSYYYQLSYLVAIENPNMTSKDAVLRSANLMEGNRSKLFILQLSFIGWAILAALTFGIGCLWLIPYIQFAIIIFYNFVNGKNTNTVAELVVEEKTEKSTEDNINPIQ